MSLGIRTPFGQRAARTAVVAASTFALLAPVAAANATAVGDTQGCPVSYWKTHEKVWQEYTARTTLGTMLAPHGAKAAKFPKVIRDYQTRTMHSGLRFGGGPGVRGAAATLLKQSTAAYLNAAYDVVPDGSQGLFFPYHRYSPITIHGVEYPALQSAVTAALGSGDRTTMLALAAKLAAANSLSCPLTVTAARHAR